ncbi:MAG TPA: 7TM diverse intracellular signaling domain-containing protein [Rectinemataceae bacterium]|nr:7TM diverse intracellular signaling domain-containing protein [Rectinemataceae bacterium]
MKTFRILLALLALAASPLLAQDSGYKGVQRSPGSIDLSGMPAKGLAELSCKWDLWPNRFVDPAVAAKGAAPYEATVPSHWDSLGIPGLVSTGYATYHLQVLGLPRDRILGLRIRSPLSAARVFVDGAQVLSIGQPSSDPATDRPRWDSQIVVLGPRQSDRLDLVIHVSNYVDFSGGLNTPLVLGDYKAIMATRTDLITLEMMEVGALAIVGFYSLLLFSFRPSELYSLFFGLLAFIFAFRTLCYDEFLLLFLFPQLPFEALFRSSYLTFSLPFFLLAAFFRSLFPRFFPAWLLLAFSAFSFAYSAFIVFAPMHSVALSLATTLKLALLALLIAIIVLVRALVARSPGSVLLLVGFAVFALSAMNDILMVGGSIHGIYVVPFGTILFFLTLSVMITRNSAIAMRTRMIVMVDREKPRLVLSEKGLSAAEIAYSMALLAGRNVKTIAADFEVSESTVRNSLARAYAKLQVQSMSSFLSLASKYEVLAQASPESAQGA